MYMVAITLTTVGYREVLEPTPATVVWTMGILVFGFIAAMVFVGLLIALIVEGEVGRLIGSRQLESQIKHMQDHVIICGLGRMGTMLVKHLQGRKVPVVVVEKDPEACRQAEKLKALYIVGDATDEASLEKAGIDRARSLVAALRSDADNMFATLTARQMRPDLFIVARAEQFSAETKLRRAGANRVISPQAIGAERIANVLTRPHLVDFVEVAARGLEFEMDAVVIASDSPIAGKTLKEANIRATADVMVVAIREPDGTTRFNPGADEVLRPNDTLITIGPEGAASRLTELHIIREGSLVDERDQPTK
jgi:voltage-gated potassium channel